MNVNPVFRRDLAAAAAATAPWLATLLLLGTPTSSFAQLTNAPAADPIAAAITSLETRQMPRPPWLSGSAPQSPDWYDDAGGNDPFRLPGLGTASIGVGSLPGTSGAIRNRAKSKSTLIPAGPFDVHFNLAYAATYGNGLLSGPGKEESTLQQTVTPTMTVFAGERWNLAYSPSAHFYSSDAYKDKVDHTVELSGSATWQNWNYGLNHATAVSSTPLIETGRQTDQATHSTGANAHLDLDGQNSLSVSVGQNIRFADGSPDMYSWSNNNWFDHPWTETLSSGIGVGAGYDLMDPGTDMPHERVNARIEGQLGTKVTYSVSGGAEFRQFMGSDLSTRISPLVSGTLDYEVLDKTSLSAGFDRSVGTSYFNNQLTENTSISFGLRQRFSGRWSASVNGGFRFTSYQSTQVSGDAVREDGSTFATAAVNWRVTTRFSTTFAYSYRANDSDSGDYTYDSHQFSLRLNYSL